MAVNKVEINGEVKLDLTQDTVTPQSLLQGTTAHNAAGEEIEGVVTVPTKTSDLTNDSGFLSSNNEGTAGQVLTKTENGQEWSNPSADSDTVLLKSVPITMPVSANWRSMAYGDGKFVAITRGSSTIAYSTDGIDWNEITLPTYTGVYWQDVTYGDGKFVIIPPSGNVGLYSTDGINWVKTTMAEYADWNTMAYGDGKFVVFTFNSNIIEYSTDGINWVKTTSNSTSGIRPVAYGKGKFVAIKNDSNTIEYSTDSITWNTSTLPLSASWQSIIYANGKFIAVATRTDTYVYSTDGINWIQGTFPLSANWGLIAYGNDKFIAMTIRGDTAAYSTDGITWTQISMISATYWRSLVYGGDKFVAIANNSDTVAISYDGITWSSTVQVLQHPDGTDIHEQVKTALQIEMPDMTITADTTTKITGLLKGANGKVTQAQANSDYATPEYVKSFVDRYFYVNGSLLDHEIDQPDSEFQALCVEWYGFLKELQPSSTIPPYPNPVLCCAVSGDKTTTTMELRISGFLNDDSLIFTGAYASLSGYSQMTVTVRYYVNDNQLVVSYCEEIPLSPQVITGTIGSAGLVGSVSHTYGEIESFLDIGYPVYMRLTIADNDSVYLTGIEKEESAIQFYGWSNDILYAVTFSSSNEKVTYIKRNYYDYIPKARKITLTVAGWDSSTKQQTVSIAQVSGSASSQEIRPTPVNTTMDNPYDAAGIRCVAQAANKLTFGCETIPTEAIEVYVVIQDVIYLG